jgi:uncharacterized lipoprotein NlpE involved in copper resistance
MQGETSKETTMKLTHIALAAAVALALAGCNQQQQADAQKAAEDAKAATEQADEAA